jgi:prevent-host-death family protein
MATMGIRELRDSLTRVLRRVEAGERVEVTRDGRPIAVIAPLDDDPLARLIAERRVRPPLKPFRATVPRSRWPLDRSSTDVISQGRDDRV